MRACPLFWQSAGSNRRGDCRRKHAADLYRMWAGGTSHVHLLLRFNVQVSGYSQSSTAASAVQRCFVRQARFAWWQHIAELSTGRGWGFEATRGEFNVVSPGNVFTSIEADRETFLL